MNWQKKQKIGPKARPCAAEPYHSCKLDQNAMAIALIGIKECVRKRGWDGARAAYANLGKIFAFGCPSIKKYIRYSLGQRCVETREFTAEKIGLSIFACHLANNDCVPRIGIDLVVLDLAFANIQKHVKKWERNGTVRACIDLGKKYLEANPEYREVDKDNESLLMEEIGLHFFILMAIHGYILEDCDGIRKGICNGRCCHLGMSPFIRATA